MIRKIAFDYWGGLIIKDQEQTHIFDAEEGRQIITAVYKYVQKKKAGIYKD